MLIRPRGSSPRAVWAKTQVVTDMVEDDSRCEETVWGLQDFVGGGREMVLAMSRA